MKLHIVKCPHCGYEYSAAELIVPSTLLEKPYFVKRDEHGHILGALGKEGSLTDTYRCDACNKKFEIAVDVTFTLNKLEGFSEVAQISLL